MANNNASYLRLTNWIKGIARLANAQQMAELADELQDDTLDLIDEQFKKGIGPNGIKLQRKKNPDGKQPLTNTGALSKSFRSGRSGWRGFNVQSDKMDEYGKYHQRGRKTPWKIHPKKPGGVLRFRIGSQIIYTKEVTHPGYPARPIYPSEKLPKRYYDKYIKTVKNFYMKKGFRFSRA